METIDYQNLLAKKEAEIKALREKVAKLKGKAPEIPMTFGGAVLCSKHFYMAGPMNPYSDV